MLLTEWVPLKYDRQLIVEAARTGGPIILKNVVLQRADDENQNGRIYPMGILQREVKKYGQVIDERRALGELDHPESPVVNLKNASHNITEAYFRGNDLVGTMEVLSTPMGNILRELLKNNILLGVSSRGLGSIRELGEGTVEVQDDYSLICFDVVSNPSTQGAFINESVAQAEIQKVVKWNRVSGLVHDFLTELK